MQNSRRQFLTRLLTVASGSSVLFISPRIAAETPVPAAPKETTARGYRETDHVRAYYQRINF
ncbi:MAG: formate dehydrogenase [Gammaproteobacteria bacterium]